MTPREKVAEMLRRSLTEARDAKQRERADMVNEIAICEGAIQFQQQGLASKQSKLAEIDAEIGEINSQLKGLEDGK